MVRGHTLEWFYKQYDNHWSRLDGCTAYRQYLQQRIQRDVVSDEGCDGTTNGAYGTGTCRCHVRTRQGVCVV